VEGADGQLRARTSYDTANESPRLITDAYREQQAWLHENTEYGTASIQYAPLVAEIVNNLEITHLLDYGCSARMNLLKSLHGKIKGKLTYQGYDPCVPEYSAAPIPAQMVACIDVLEHIEPDCLENVLDHLAKLTECVAFITVHTGPAGKTLPDGRNAHINQQPMSYWLSKLWQRFDLHTVQVTAEHAFHVIAYAKPRIELLDGSKAV
jgi:hypothetical protein